MADNPSTDNYTLGKGVVYFNQRNAAGVYLGERDLGNAPAFTFNVDIENLEHFSSRGGLQAKDKDIISQITPGCSFTLDEISKENFALNVLGDIEERTQVIGAAEEEEVVANLGNRAELNFRNIQAYALPYNTGTEEFNVGATLTGGTSGATAIILAKTGTTTEGTLTVALLTATNFDDDETVTDDGSTAGSATVNSADGAVLITGTPVVLVTDSTGSTTYTAGTDYEISELLKDDEIGRIHFLNGGTITNGSTVKVSYGYGAATFSVVKAFEQTQLEGMLRFVSDNPAGNQYELQIWRVSLSPDGDTALIGDDWSTLAFTGEILKDEVGHPNSPYMDIYIQ